MVAGEDNIADLMARHLGAAKISKYTNQMAMKFESGRAAKAAQLHVLQEMTDEPVFHTEMTSLKWSEIFKNKSKRSQISSTLNKSQNIMRYRQLREKSWHSRRSERSEGLASFT